MANQGNHIAPIINIMSYKEVESYNNKKTDNTTIENLKTIKNKDSFYKKNRLIIYFIVLIGILIASWNMLIELLLLMVLLIIIGFILIKSLSLIFKVSKFLIKIALLFAVATSVLSILGWLLALVNWFSCGFHLNIIVTNILIY